MKNVTVMKNIKPSATLWSPNVVRGLKLTHSNQEVFCNTISRIAIDWDSGKKRHFVFIDNPIIQDYHKRMIDQEWDVQEQVITSGNNRHVKIGVKKLLIWLEENGYENRL